MVDHIAAEWSSPWAKGWNYAPVIVQQADRGAAVQRGMASAQSIEVCHA